MMRNIGSYFKVVDADEHRIIEELKNLREKKCKDAHDISAADAEEHQLSRWIRQSKRIEEKRCALTAFSLKNECRVLNNRDSTLLHRST